jgi:hypothetical protein
MIGNATLVDTNLAAPRHNLILAAAAIVGFRSTLRPSPITPRQDYLAELLEGYMRKIEAAIEAAAAGKDK